MSVADIIKNKLTSDTEDFGTKGVTVRLSLLSYAKLSVLSKELGSSPSGFSKELLEDAISEAVDGFIHFTGNDINPDIGSLFDELQTDEAN